MRFEKSVGKKQRSCLKNQSRTRKERGAKAKKGPLSEAKKADEWLSQYCFYPNTEALFAHRVFLTLWAFLENRIKTIFKREA